MFLSFEINLQLETEFEDIQLSLDFTLHMWKSVIA